MGLIIAGTSPLAADMVGASIMGFEIDDIPVFRVARDFKMTPSAMSEIEIRGLSVNQTKRKFLKPDIVTWGDFGYKEI
jgi:hypothetical protein